MNAQDIRKIFLDYFKSQGHSVVPSGALVPDNDPSLFFTNAGMVPFKNLFLGEEQRDYTRATSTQKCLRVAGKHNDLEEVGRTPRHHTLFEMLGNFSFGDYFKEEAIAFAWELLTKHYKLPADRLIVTVFEDDDEAEEMWTKWLPKDRIFRFDAKDNFWSMGDTGPCGPCSEIHYDWHPEQGAPTPADIESGRCWEVWNLVFMQYNRSADGEMTPLAKPCIDTGMGLERLCSVLQNKQSNYDTDLFTPIIACIEELTNTQYGHTDEPSDVSIRVIADHIRATSFLIADGILPSNEGRGYVLRRIMRRAIRHGKMLGMSKPFFADVLPVVVAEMGDAFPELIQQQQFVDEVVRNEETRFFETLDHGLKLLREQFTTMADSGTKVVDGAVAFKLYDTFGFPKDLTQDIAAENGFTVDHAGFDNCMEQQREQARAAWKGSGSAAIAPVYQELANTGNATTFTGYTEDHGTATVVALVQDNTRIERAEAGATVGVIVDTTPFYGEGGGQVGDTGTMTAPGVVLTVKNTIKPVPTVFVHTATLEKGALAVGDTLTLNVNTKRRDAVRKNHTATHLLHKALRSCLGEHVRQAGSSVDETRLRFDFTHFSSLSDEQLSGIERDVNQVIQQNIALDISEQSKDDAVAKGAMAFFGEKYGETVRVVDVPGYSIELCGGIHVAATGEIGLCKITSEGSVASGVRRLEAVTGSAAINYLQQLEHQQRQVAADLKVAPQDIGDKVHKLQQQVKQLERDLSNAKTKAATGDTGAQIEDVAGIQLLAQVLDGLDPKSLRSVGDQYRSKMGSGVIALGTVHEEKASVIVMVTDDLTKRFKAGDLIKPIVAALDGRGGGRPDMAQGGGPKVEALAGALAGVKLQLVG